MKMLKPNSKKYKEYKKNLYLTNIEKEILIGSMLGDLYLQKTSIYNYRLRFEQGEIHKDYIFHIYEIFNKFILKEPTKIERINKLGNKNITYRLQSITHSEFNFLADLFINDNGKKHVPKDLIKNHLTTRGLTYWFMDDGSKLDYSKNEGKGIVLNTQQFSVENVNQMSLELNEKFKLNSWVGLNKSRPIIKISGENFEKMIEYMKPYLIPSMYYKLPSLRKKNSILYKIYF